MTHVLNAALRQVLGENVDRRGNLCNDEKLRFDFSHKKAMTAAELKKTEEICQTIVKNAESVSAKTMPLEEAQALDGVRAVLSSVKSSVKSTQILSVLFPLARTPRLNYAEARILSTLPKLKPLSSWMRQTAVAKGIQRITAVTREAAKQALVEGEGFVSKVIEAEKLDSKTEGLDKQAGAIRKELDETFVSAALKAKLRARIEHTFDFR
jgi:alanyl-tRNA synthetase